MTTKHTPTPWKAEDNLTIWASVDDSLVAKIAGPSDTDQESSANARFICKAVNSHDELVGALNKVVALHDDDVFVFGTDDETNVYCALDAARAILAKLAKGEE